MLFSSRDTEGRRNVFIRAKFGGSVFCVMRKYHLNQSTQFNRGERKSCIFRINFPDLILTVHNSGNIQNLNYFKRGVRCRIEAPLMVEIICWNNASDGI